MIMIIKSYTSSSIYKLNLLLSFFVEIIRTVYIFTYDLVVTMDNNNSEWAKNEKRKKHNNKIYQKTFNYLRTKLWIKK